MNFYHSIHRHYCGIDLHARSLYAYILDEQADALLAEIPFMENQAPVLACDKWEKLALNARISDKIPLVFTATYCRKAIK